MCLPVPLWRPADVVLWDYNSRFSNALQDETVGGGR